MDTHKNTFIKHELEMTPLALSADVSGQLTAHHESDDLSELIQDLHPHVLQTGPSTPVGNGDSIDISQFEIIESKEKEEKNATD